MKRLLLSFFATVILLASCAPPIIEEPELDVWEFPEPEGLFVFHEMHGQGIVRFGLVNALGEVAVPFVYDHISTLQPYSRQGQQMDLIAEERFFKALNFERVMYGEEPGWALISPAGSFLTGFYYIDISRMPGDPAQIIARRTDSPEQFVLLDSYGEESIIEDEHLIYTLTKHYFWSLPREEWWRFGPDVPEHGFEWTLETLSGNFWGAPAYLEGEERPEIQEVRFYRSDGVLLDNKVYHFVEYIGEGLYLAMVHTARASESFIVNYNGRRLAGPYESFVHNRDALPFLLGVSGRYANVLSTDSFRELRAIHVPQYGWIELVGRSLQSFAVVSSQTLPLTITMLGSGEEIIFESFIDYALGGHNPELSRFILRSMGYHIDPEPGSFPAVLVDRQGNVLAYGQSFSSQFGYIVAGLYDEYGELMYALLDWDGNILLPPEFDHLEVLPGNALFAASAGRVGIIDLGGNWIY